jgi:hypothetical protein
VTGQFTRIAALITFACAMASAPLGHAEAAPTWELSGGGRVAYDTNAYATEVERPGFPLANREAVDTQLFLKACLSPFLLSPFLSKSDWKDTTISYQLTQHWFDRRAATENHTAHKLQVVAKGMLLGWKLAADLATTYIDGSRESPRYLTYSSYGMAVPRDRRAQWQHALKGSLRRESGAWSTRIVGAYTSFDLLTRHHNPTGAYLGYLNYIDRYDLNGGLDLGHKAGKALAWFGIRVGEQYQQALPWALVRGTSSYARALASVEGKTGDVAYAVTAGPDFRSYHDPKAVVDRSQTTLFLDSTLTWTVRKGTTVGLTAKQWRWVSSSGRATYDDFGTSVTVKHQMSKTVALRGLAQWQRGYYVTPTNRIDHLYTLGGGATLDFTPKVSAALDYVWTRDENGVAGAAFDGREYRRHQVTLEVRARW